MDHGHTHSFSLVSWMDDGCMVDGRKRKQEEIESSGRRTGVQPF